MTTEPEATEIPKTFSEYIARYEEPYQKYEEARNRIPPEMNTTNKEMNTVIKKGESPAIGASAMCGLCIGWTDGDGSGHDGYNAGDYFDRHEVYLGPDEHGIEPVFREMTEEEIYDYRNGDEW